MIAFGHRRIGLSRVRLPSTATLPPSLIAGHRAISPLTRSCPRSIDRTEGRLLPVVNPAIAVVTLVPSRRTAKATGSILARLQKRLNKLHGSHTRVMSVLKAPPRIRTPEARTVAPTGVSPSTFITTTELVVVRFIGLTVIVRSILVAPLDAPKAALPLAAASNRSQTTSWGAKPLV